MLRIVGHFHDLHFTESYLGAPIVEDGVLKIPVSGIIPLRGHPLSDSVLKSIDGCLIFYHVSKSTRKITEYIGDPKKPRGFKEEYVVEDILTESEKAGGEIFLLEGILRTPVAWVEWEIQADSFELLAEWDE